MSTVGGEMIGTEGPLLLRAVAFCEENAGNPVELADIASAARTGVRTLQRAFQVKLGTTPMSYLRAVRLRRVRADLIRIQAGQAAGTVSDVAVKWGFTHLGRFSQNYRDHYGEYPSDTIRFGHRASAAYRPPRDNPVSMSNTGLIPVQRGLERN